MAGFASESIFRMVRAAAEKVIPTSETTSQKYGTITGVVSAGDGAGAQLTPVPGFTDLWEIPAANCNLIDGRIYHYWFEVAVSHPERPADVRLRITDPFAYSVDWRLCGPRIDPPFGDDDRYPTAVIKFSAGKLIAADASGETGDFSGGQALSVLAANNRLVIYELPTTWTRSAEVGGRDMGIGTFRDVAALIDAHAEGANFDDLDITRLGRSYLTEIGVNALELLPPADSTYNRQWGYGTTNYLAPDFDLGFPLIYSSPAPNRDLADLIRTCHTHGLRFFADVVMAFAKNNPYLAAACDDFFLLDPAKNKSDPNAHNSRSDGDNDLRNGFGATLFRPPQSHGLSPVRVYRPCSGSDLSHLPRRRGFSQRASVQFLHQQRRDRR